MADFHSGVNRFLIEIRRVHGDWESVVILMTEKNILPQ